jgi:hypothetical protein
MNTVERFFLVGVRLTYQNSLTNTGIFKNNSEKGPLQTTPHQNQLSLKKKTKKVSNMRDRVVYELLQKKPKQKEVRGNLLVRSLLGLRNLMPLTSNTGCHFLYESIFMF